MKEVGIINRGIAKVISEQGHNDYLMVVDAGFAIPTKIEVVDISLGENKPMVLDVLYELKKFFSVEKIILAEQTQRINEVLPRETNEDDIYEKKVVLVQLDRKRLKAFK